ncbi:MAG: hypothetical protein JWL68_845 [Actinomycetia bacterium]|nr:hypothetical protein [Actinomycetes bacterium]
MIPASQPKHSPEHRGLAPGLTDTRHARLRRRRLHRRDRGPYSGGRLSQPGDVVSFARLFRRPGSGCEVFCRQVNGRVGRLRPAGEPRGLRAVGDREDIPARGPRPASRRGRAPPRASTAWPDLRRLCPAVPGTRRAGGETTDLTTRPAVATTGQIPWPPPDTTRDRHRAGFTTAPGQISMALTIGRGDPRGRARRYPRV